MHPSKTGLNSSACVCIGWTYIFCRCHPYIFFNKDQNSMTFIGFCATFSGDLIDPISEDVICERILSEELKEGLSDQDVSFDDYDLEDQ